MTTSYIKHCYSWKWAFTKNCSVPLIEVQKPQSLVSYVPAVAKALMKEYADFACNETEKRERSGHIPYEWSLMCQLRSATTQHYSPRWTAPLFYFRGEFLGLFVGKTGLDVGARVGDAESILKRRIWAMGSQNPLFIDSLIPHFRHYSNAGCKMRAIDLNVPDPIHSEIEFGDARCLVFSAESFDFASVPMLLGQGNPCATYLEIVFCLSELKRVLRPGGLIYFADAGFQPLVGFAAQCLGLDLFVSKGSENGLPVGYLLRKQKKKLLVTSFDFIFKTCRTVPVIFSDSADEIVYNCNLIFDKEPVVIGNC